MQENAGKLKDDDKKRYDAQMTTITRILAVFDDPQYKDEDPEKSAEVVALMSEVRFVPSQLASPPDAMYVDANTRLTSGRVDGAAASGLEPWGRWYAEPDR